MHISIMKIKNHKLITILSFKFFFKKKKNIYIYIYIRKYIYMSKTFPKIYINFEKKKMLSFHCIQGSIIMLFPNK